MLLGKRLQNLLILRSPFSYPKEIRNETESWKSDEALKNYSKKPRKNLDPTRPTQVLETILNNLERDKGPVDPWVFLWLSKKI